MIFLIVLGFLLGAAAVLVAQALVLLYVLRRLRPNISQQQQAQETPVGPDLDPDQSIAFALNKQGVVWVLEPEKVPKSPYNGGTPAKASKDHISRKDIKEVYPVKKYAKIKDHCLTLTNLDGSHATIQLVGCVVQAVSSSSLASRKWAKRYPIKIENKVSVIYNGSNVLYVYLETSWDKESWCRALRLASSADNRNLNWHKVLSDEFQSYFTLLMSEYPFLKPQVGSKEAIERVGNRMVDGSSSKVRLFLKKFAKKASKNSAEYKIGAALPSLGREEINSSGEKFVADSQKDKFSNNSPDEDVTIPSDSNYSGARNQFPAGSDAKPGYDEGTLCCNLLLARFFFDARKSDKISSFLLERIQRALSNLRTPSYIGEISCVNFDIGALPPYIHGIRVLPMDINEVWAMELDIEYSGRAVLEVGTRLEVSEPDFRRGIMNASMEAISAEDVSSDLLDRFEHYDKELKRTSGVDEEKIKSIGRDNLEGMSNTKNTRASSYASRWKSILNSVADQVSQVPLSLAIRFMSVRGTLRVHIKPPPSDQLWFCFTSMPNIDWKFDSSVGESKISSAHIAMLIGSRFKAAIRESLVLPNCETICIPWMLAEKDDWVPRKFAPFVWINHEGGPSAVYDGASSSLKPDEGNRKDSCCSTESSICNSNVTRDDASSNELQDEQENLPNVEFCRQNAPPTENEPPLGSCSATSNTKEVIHVKDSSELMVPLLQKEQDERIQEFSFDTTMIKDQNVDFLALDDGKPKKVGRRAKMIDIGKKMSEKLEEKRRHLEEKSRQIVEKMRENTKTT